MSKRALVFAFLAGKMKPGSFYAPKIANICLLMQCICTFFDQQMVRLNESFEHVSKSTSVMGKAEQKL